MQRLVFYSWQSDLPNATNRSFVQQALEHVGKAIAADNTIDIEPVIDRDTQGVAGAPDIAKTIFEKIKAADVFVADVSIIGAPRKGRPTPNPNVLIELGYALHALGEELVILVFNTAFGRLDQLPFDLKMRRAIPYNMPESATDRASERKVLEGKLDHAIRSALKHPKSVMQDKISDLEPRLAKHKALAIPRLENVTDFGHIGIYCLPYGSTTISVRELEEFVSKHRLDFSWVLRHGLQPEPFQLGISLEYRPRAFGAEVKSTARVTLYRDGLIAFDAQADMDMGKAVTEWAHTLNLYWLCYEVQRQLQLAKAILSVHGVGRIRTIVELDHIEELSLLVSAEVTPSATRKHPYSGTHEAILRDTDLSDIHDYGGPKRNVIMPVVLEITDEVCGIFNLSATPSNVSSADGQLTYVKGLENQR